MLMVIVMVMVKVFFIFTQILVKTHEKSWLKQLLKGVKMIL